MSVGADPPHGELGPELRKLAQSILDRLDPQIRAAAALASSGEGPGKCQQVWCPVCALAAVVTGEEHPLVTLVAEHGVAIFDVIRASLSDADTMAAQSRPSDAGDSESAGTPPGYQNIPITIENSPHTDPDVPQT